MPKCLHIAEHLSTTELEGRYRQATDPVARSQWQMLWLLAGGQSTAQVAQHTGYSERRLWELSDVPLASRSFADLTELETVQAERCRALRPLRRFM